MHILLDLGPLNDTTLIMQLVAVVGDAVTARVAISYMAKERSAPPF